MEILTVFFAITAVLSVGFYLWMKYTESGRRRVEGEYKIFII